MKHKYILPLLIGFLWLTLVVCFYMFLSTTETSFENFFFGIYNFIQKSGVWGVLIFVGIYCFRPLFFIVATPFDLLSGLIFGFWGGLGVSFLANISSIAFSYGVGYITGGKYITIPERFLKLKKIEKNIRKKTFFHILILRVLLFPFDFLSYVSGVFRIPFKKFWSASVLGSYPITAISVITGSAFYGKELQNFQELSENINYRVLWVGMSLLILFLVFIRVLKKSLKTRK